VASQCGGADELAGNAAGRPAEPATDGFFGGHPGPAARWWWCPPC
jgi:hypothetical protein